MAQEWSMRYRLVDGQGNLDLLMVTAPQCVIQMNKISEEILADIKKETVDFQLNLILYSQK
jgi:DNA gyrase subunit A